MRLEPHETRFLWGARAVIRTAMARRFPERLGASEPWKPSFRPGSRDVSQAGEVSVDTKTGQPGIEPGN